jgi:hypothetical protein
VDQFMTWNNFTVTGMVKHEQIDDFYRGYLSCKRKESIQFNFRNDKSVS